MSDDEKDVFEEAMEHNDDVLGIHDEIKLDEPEVVHRSSPPRTSVTEIINNPPSDKKIQKSEKYIEISVSYPEKIGSGMNSYFIYKISTKTNRPSFLHQEITVRRRFSDFLGLYERLKNKYLCAGCIIPPAPEKNVFGNTKTKLAKEDQTNSEFLERRRASLERYLLRISRHPLLVIDADFREFLEDDRDLPKAVNTQALSGASVKKLFKNVGDVVGKITTKMEDCDQWFEDKQVEMDNLERHLTQIHSNFEHLIGQRKELATQIKVFAQHCSQLSHVEEHNGLARALAQLSSTKEEISAIEERQAEVEFFTLLELLKDYLGLIGAIKDVLTERIRQYRVWQDAESNLNKKREQKVRCELSNKTDKIPALDTEIKECLNRVDRTKDDFEKISKTIKKEIEVFDLTKVTDFKESIIKVLETMITSQEEIIHHWEKYVPDTTGIST